jgi:hypothetical protein
MRAEGRGGIILTVRRTTTMPTAAKDRQISVRIASETDAWLELRAGSSQNKAGFIRQLIERERAREREQELLETFNAAAADVTAEDLEERESLLGGFAGGPAE